MQYILESRYSAFDMNVNINMHRKRQGVSLMLDMDFVSNKAYKIMGSAHLKGGH